jgi:hypothetical protein
MAVFLVFWISLAVHPTKLLKKTIKKGYSNNILLIHKPGGEN